MSKPLVVLTTTGSEQQALSIAEELIQNEYTASVNIIPGLRTIYRFNGKIFDDDETLMIIKTMSDSFTDVSECINRLHTYEIPEIMAIEADKWTGKFFNWLQSNIHMTKAKQETKN